MSSNGTDALVFGKLICVIFIVSNGACQIQEVDGVVNISSCPIKLGNLAEVSIEVFKCVFL